MAGVPILIVDDSAVDRFIIKKAVTNCCAALGISVDIRTATGPEQAKTEIAQREPALLITDLFMPKVGAEEEWLEFSRLPIDTQYAEMEYPAGLRMLDGLKQHKFRRLVTTFFWNYPGFSRYRRLFDDQKVDAALPKDIFYLVGSLAHDTLTEDAPDFPPLRILLQVLSTLCRNEAPAGGRPSIDRLHLRSLFDEASAWLAIHSYNVLQIRADVTKALSGEGLKRKRSAGDAADEIATFGIAASWMPTFVVVSSAGRDSSPEGAYVRVMRDLEQDRGWRIHLELPDRLGLVDDKLAPETWQRLTDGTESLFSTRRAQPVRIDKFLIPQRADDKPLAQLLVTLGFFSYWCHLSDHRASRTADEISSKIQKATGHPYRNLEKKKLSERVGSDVDVLNRHVLDKIRGDTHNEWWRHLNRNAPPTVIGFQKDNPNETVREAVKNQKHYWLNASLVLTDKVD